MVGVEYVGGGEGRCECFRVCGGKCGFSVLRVCGKGGGQWVMKGVEIEGFGVV